MRKIKVLILHGSELNNAGTERFLMNLYRKLHGDQFHFDFMVFGMKQGFHDHEILSKHSKIYRMPISLEDWKYLRLIKKNKKDIKEESYDIVHAHMNALNHRMFQFLNFIPIKISHSHASNHFVKSHLLRMILNKEKNKIHTQTDFLLACSNEAGSFLYGDYPFKIIHNGIELNQYCYQDNQRKSLRQKYQFNDNDLLLSQIGRISFEKNHDFSLEVLAEILKIQANVHLLIIGNGPTKKLRKKIKAMSIEPHVHFIENQDAIEPYYSMVDAILLPSLFEGFGYTALEAQVSGLQVYASHNVPHILNLSPSIHFLDYNSKLWAQTILKNQFRVRHNQIQILSEKGFNLDFSVKQMKNIYLSSIKKASIQ